MIPQNFNVKGSKFSVSYNDGWFYKYKNSVNEFFFNNQGYLFKYSDLNNFILSSKVLRFFNFRNFLRLFKIN